MLKTETVVCKHYFNILSCYNLSILAVLLAKNVILTDYIKHKVYTIGLRFEQQQITRIHILNIYPEK